MGAWDVGPFDNDGALDLLAEIRMGDFSFESFTSAFEDEDYLEIDAGQMAVALAALVRITNQDPGAPDNPLGEADLAAFAAQLTPERISWIRQQQERALSDGEHSELYELWAETDSLNSWLEASSG